jgi:NADH:ubiquinone oxidoreductase subunit F (NADH-binding)
MTGSKVDIVVMDKKLAQAILTTEQLQALTAGDPPVEVLQLVVDAVVMLYECKTTTSLGLGRCGLVTIVDKMYVSSNSVHRMFSGCLEMSESVHDGVPCRQPNEQAIASVWH